VSEPDNIILVYLRRRDEKADRLIADNHDSNARLAGVEESPAGVHRRIDRLEMRVERIEKRLDLVDAPH
jgi:hypothetical protein